jgi:hypothetical protein
MIAFSELAFLGTTLQKNKSSDINKKIKKTTIELGCMRMETKQVSFTYIYMIDDLIYINYTVVMRACVSRFRVARLRMSST